ncbi:MAG: hypothetical protein D6737_11085 [Chloroflexi bacterium]|nr:MAG: hypothetical protein D6737_11085 [Chloroflexota bacterium]
MDALSQLSQADLEIALEKAYRRGFHQALTLLATFYPNGIGNRELAKLANEHLIWRRELGESPIADTVTPRFIHDISPLEKKNLGA